jgi:hypothetical protein
VSTPSLASAIVPDLRTARHMLASLEIFPGGVPNIDGYSIDPDDFSALAEVFSALAEYSDLIALAHRARAAGRIPEAGRLERRAERIYNRLPAGARW